MTDEIAQLKALLDSERQPANPLRPHQVRAYREESARLNDIVNAPTWVEGDRTQATKRYRSLNQMLTEQAPRPTERPNDVKRLADEVLAKHIQPAMLAKEVMRRNPAGAVGQYIRQERDPQTKRGVQEWKRAQWALDPGNEDPDHSNLERFRPEIGPQSGTATHMVGAQIAGHAAFSPQAKENWPENMPPQGTVMSPLVQAQAREAVVKKKRGRPPMPEAQKQYLREQALARHRAKVEAATNG